MMCRIEIDNFPGALGQIISCASPTWERDISDYPATPSFLCRQKPQKSTFFDQSRLVKKASSARQGGQRKVARGERSEGRPCLTASSRRASLSIRHMIGLRRLPSSPEPLPSWCASLSCRRPLQTRRRACIPHLPILFSFLA